MKRFALRFLPCALLCAAAACSSNNSTSVVTTTIAPGAQCPNGGVSITVNSGTPEIVCNGTTGSTGGSGATGGTGAIGGTGSTGSTGANGFNTLVATTSLPPGNSHCPAGGEEIDSGLDNGSGGGVANDGILQPGEITNTSYICNDGDEHIGSITPPGGAAGTSTINASGGQAFDAGGGGGAMVDIQIDNGTVGGNAMIFKTGQADPSFSFPAAPTPDLGANPVNVSGSTSVGLIGNLLSDAGAGTLVIDGNNFLAVLEDDGGTAEATSLTIPAGATLTRTDDGDGSIAIVVQGACLNSGTITASDSNSSLIIECQGYFGAVGSSITNNGATGSAGATGATGVTGVTGVTGSSGVPGGTSGGITLESDALYNHGLIQANGGDGANGGNGGPVYVGYLGTHIGTPLFNDGAIQSFGGAGLSGNGGNGNTLDLEGSGDVNNAGALDAHGGGGTLGGGNGGQIIVEGGEDYTGSAHNSGALTSTGGSVSASCTNAGNNTCAAGNGGEIDLETDDGVLVSNAQVTTHGGSSANGPGGSGGQISIDLYGLDSSPNGGDDDSLPSGDLTLSGSLDSSGGSGSYGGSAGRVGISMNTGSPNGQQIILYGYASVNVSGGSGINGGGAGCFALTNSYYQEYIDDTRVAHPRSNYSPYQGDGPGGAVVNYASIIARGGNGTAATLGEGDELIPGGNGGSGGNIQMRTQSFAWFADDTFEQAWSEGPIDTSGGDGSQGGSNGGIYVYGIGGSNSDGNLTARQGNGLSGSSGGYSSVRIFSDYGVAESSGSIDVTGGASTPTVEAEDAQPVDDANIGGQGGNVQVHGYSATVAGTITAVGGAPAGSGGTIDVQSIGGGSSSVTAPAPASINVSPGTGTIEGNDGIAGTVTVDGWNVTNAWTN